MKKLIILGLVLLMVVGLATSVCGKAQKVDLVDDTTGDVYGWVIANKNASGDIILEGHVQKAPVDTLFYVFIKDLYWEGFINDEESSIGEFTTNAAGNANFHFTIPSEFEDESNEIVKVVVREAWPNPESRYYTANDVPLEF